MHTRRRHKLKGMRSKVMLILISDKKARDSDDYLFCEYIKVVKPELLNMSLEDAFKDSDIPYYESVRRCRQWIQHKYPELGGSTEVQAMRMLNEEVFRNFAREHTE